jgi:geranylgeranyl diphosphate synthase, type II
MESTEPVSNGPYSAPFGAESFPMLIGQAGEFLSYAEPRRMRIETALEEYLADRGRAPAVLYEAMQYAVLSGGKRLRPLLCVVAAEVCGKTLDDVLPTACGLEMIHAQSLIHDDLPAIDDDRIRRGRPTCHVRFGEAIAILAGDALMARAFEVFATQRKTAPAHLVLDMMELVAKAIGREGMAGGEAEDVLSEGKPGDMKTLQFVHDHKSGDFIGASLLAGAILCNGPNEVRERLAMYGTAIGLAFQIVDDILGEAGDPRRLGKPVGRDEERKKLTYPRLLGIRKSRELAAAKAQEALAAIEGLGPGSDPLRALGLYVLHRNV